MIKNKPYPWYHDEYMDNLKDYLERCANKFPNNIAFSYKRKGQLIEKTYMQFLNDVKKVTIYIKNKKILKNNIGIIGENSYEWIVLYLSIANSQNVVVPIDKELNIEDVEHILNETEAKLLFYSDLYLDYAEKIKKENINIELININDISLLLNDNNELNDDILYEYKKIKPLADDPIAIIYTSGTTGNPKGVILTNKNICSDVLSGLKNLNMYQNTILALPLHHTYSFTAATIGVMFYGCNNYINSSLKNLAKDMVDQKPSFMYMVPLMIETFYKNINKEIKSKNKLIMFKILMFMSRILLYLGIDIRKKIFKNILNIFGGKLDFIVSGGAALDIKYQKWFYNIGINILVGYGITECSPLVSVNRNKYFKHGSVGLLMPDIDAKINLNNNETIGEICLKGNILMKGYYKDNQMSQKAIDDEGYFKTGDIGYIDNDNFIYITGRKKNVIILSNGKNVYPEELEFILMKNEAILEVIIKEGNNNIIAEIYPNQEYISEKKITDKVTYFKKYIDSVNRTLPIYKNINDIELRDTEFEKTTTKKIKRNYLNK